jgi:putative endonuclease
MPQAYVYILTNHSRTLYIGMTSDLERRLFEHKTKALKGFTENYNIDRLVYYEEMTDHQSALAREKQLKGWTRAKKIALIERTNPHWFDLSDRWNVIGNMTGQSSSIQGPSTTASTPSLRII